ncbi:MAG: type II toxin-antitoxin system HicA family toxin [Candidatus Brocadiia bacterium]
MPDLRKVSGREAVKALEKLGFRQARQRGSHVVMVRETPRGKTGCVVPMHRELKIGTLRGILRQAKLDVDEFSEAL